MKKTYIQADKSDDGSYSATELIICDVEEHLWEFEYGDVAAKEFQIWEYPSGKIFDVIPDRTVLPDNDYSTPDPKKWLPLMQLNTTNQQLVNDAYRYLNSL